MPRVENKKPQDKNKEDKRAERIAKEVEGDEK
jgi:hypothetical protein